MYECVQVFMCVRCACLCMCKCVCTHMCVSVWVYVCVRCAFVNVYTCIYMCESVSVHASMWKCQCHMFSSIPLHLIFSLLLNLESSSSARLTGEWSTSTGFCLGARIWTQVLMLIQQSLCQLSHLPRTFFLKKKKKLRQGLIKLPLLFSNSWPSCSHLPSTRINRPHPICGLQRSGDAAQRFAWANWALYTLRSGQF